MASLKLVFAIALCMVVVAPMASEATIPCGVVNTNLAPCLNHLRNGGAVSRACCNGVRALNNAAKTTPDRRAICECIKKAAKNVGSVNLGNARSLPGKCGVSIPYKISPSTNCKTVK